MHQQTRAYLCAAGAVLCWSTVASAFKLSLRYLDPLQLAFLASVVSAVVLFVILAVQGKMRLLLRYPRKRLPLCLLAGLLNPCFYYFILFEAYDRLPAQEAMSINYSWPVMLVVLSIIVLKQPIRMLELAAIIIAYFGVIVIATHGNVFSLEFADPLGVAFAFASTLIWATFWIVNVRQKGDAVVTLFLGFACAVPVLGIVTSVVDPISDIGLEGLAGAAYVGVFEMGLTFVLWSSALKLSATTARVSTLAFVIPFLSLMVIRLVVGEEIEAATLLGLVLIVAGIVLQTIFNQRAKADLAV